MRESRYQAKETAAKYGEKRDRRDDYPCGYKSLVIVPSLGFGVRSNRKAATRFALWLDMRKVDIQLIANEEKQDRAEGGKNEAGGMITFVSRARKHVGNRAAQDRTDHAEHDRPENS
jgi:hypothetical protein